MGPRSVQGSTCNAIARLTPSRCGLLIGVGVLLVHGSIQQACMAADGAGCAQMPFQGVSDDVIDDELALRGAAWPNH